MKPTQPVPSVPIKSTTLFEVFVDDFMAATNDLSTDSLLHKSQCLLHGIHSVFPPIEVTEHGGADAIAETKLDKGEGCWDYSKELLGWIFNRKDYTISLPPDKCDKILRRLKNIKRFQRKIPQNLMEEVMGSCQDASFGIPGGAGLFSALQAALIHSRYFIKVTPAIQ